MSRTSQLPLLVVFCLLTAAGAAFPYTLIPGKDAPDDKVSNIYREHNANEVRLGLAR